LAQDRMGSAHEQRPLLTSVPAATSNEPARDQQQSRTSCVHGYRRTRCGLAVACCAFLSLIIVGTIHTHEVRFILAGIGKLHSVHGLTNSERVVAQAYSSAANSSMTNKTITPPCKLEAGCLPDWECCDTICCAPDGLCCPSQNGGLAVCCAAKWTCTATGCRSKPVENDITLLLAWPYYAIGIVYFIYHLPM